MIISQLWPGILRCVDQYRTRTGCAATLQINSMIADHDHVARLHLPALDKMLQPTWMRLGWRLVSPKHFRPIETFGNTNSFQRYIGQLLSITGQDTDPAVART